MGTFARRDCQAQKSVSSFRANVVGPFARVVRPTDFPKGHLHMGVRAWNVALLVTMGALWLASGIQREKPLLSGAKTDALQILEAQVAAHPEDVARRRSLAQTYLDARAPGLAVRAIESAPVEVRGEPTVDHVYARALLEQGRSADALLAERRVLASCDPSGNTPCDAWLMASAARRADILEQLVALGVDDAQAHPEMSAVAYHNATREARLALQ